MPTAEAPVRASTTQRYFALVAFALLVVASQLLWLTFAPITAQSAQDLDVSEGLIGDLAVINPAVFVLLAIPAGRWMDRNYAGALGTGAVLLALGASIRVLGPDSFALIAVGQTVMSLGQPLVLNGSTKIASRYFGPERQTMAISVASGAQFVGILAAVCTGGPLYDAGGLSLILWAQAGFTVLVALAALVSLRIPARTITASETPATAGSATTSAWRHDPVIWRLAALLFVGVGSYNAISTWLDSILTAFGHPGTAATAIAVTTVAGIAGAAVLPGVVAARDARRTHCLVTIAVLAAVMLLLALVHPVPVTLIALAILGFFLLGTLPIVLDWSELHVGPARAATTTGFLLLAGNLGGVIVVLSVQVLIDHPSLALLVIACWAIPGLIVTRALPRSVR
ncbi:MFS transporter [Dermacoccaceae bacterium W4C1]